MDALPLTCTTTAETVPVVASGGRGVPGAGAAAALSASAARRPYAVMGCLEGSADADTLYGRRGAVQGAFVLLPKNSSSAWLKASGFCQCAKWLASGISTSVAPGMSPAIFLACSWRMI